MTHQREPLYSAQQTRELDARAIRAGGISGYVLMQRAAQAAFRHMRHDWPQARRVLVVAGPGNNGGDAYLLAVHALRAGLDVTLAAWRTQLHGDAQRAQQAFIAAGGRIDTALIDDAMRRADIIVDGLFGSGLNRPLQEQAATWVKQLNQSGKPILALDVPSGISADSGNVLGVAVKAQLTVCFVAWKKGLFIGAAVNHAGRKRLCTLAIPDEIYADAPSSLSRLVHAALPQRPRDSHKGHYGHVLVVGGDHGMGGAVSLAGEAALRAGAGLVSVATRKRHVLALLARCPELMSKAIVNAAALAPLLDRASVVALGPGLGQQAWAQTLYARIVAQHDVPLVLDADALTLLSTQIHDFAQRDVVLTPHPGEAARLLQTSTATVQADRYHAVEMLAKRYQAVVVLKGGNSLIGTPAGQIHVCDRGNSGMASGGMGDTLTGIIAALMAQGHEPEQAACAGVLWHAVAGDLAAGKVGQRSLLARDLIACLGAAAADPTLFS